MNPFFWVGTDGPAFQTPWRAEHQHPTFPKDGQTVHFETVGDDAMTHQNCKPRKIHWFCFVCKCTLWKRSALIHSKTVTCDMSNMVSFGKMFGFFFFYDAKNEEQIGMCNVEWVGCLRGEEQRRFHKSSFRNENEHNRAHHTHVRVTKQYGHMCDGNCVQIANECQHTYNTHSSLSFDRVLFPTLPDLEYTCV